MALDSQALHEAAFDEMLVSWGLSSASLRDDVSRQCAAPLTSTYYGTLASKQQAGRQAGRQASKQASKQARVSERYTQIDRHTHIYIYVYIHHAHTYLCICVYIYI